MQRTRSILLITPSFVNIFFVVLTNLWNDARSVLRYGNDNVASAYRSKH
jgi:hypothetical protein